VSFNVILYLYESVCTIFSNLFTQTLLYSTIPIWILSADTFIRTNINISNIHLLPIVCTGVACGSLLVSVALVISNAAVTRILIAGLISQLTTLLITILTVIVYIAFDNTIES
jgi:hypothetical protein